MSISGYFRLIDWHWLWLTVAAFLAGVLNAVAGGGSFLLFPAMLRHEDTARPGQRHQHGRPVAGPAHLHRRLPRRHPQEPAASPSPWAWPACWAAPAGAVVLLNTPQMTFLHMVPWLLLVAASIFAATGPVSRWLARRKVHRQPAATHPPRRLPVFISTIFVCFYIGYFGAGAGFLLITLLSLFGYQDLNEINALKVVSTTMANGIAFLIFVVDGQVVWRYCLLAMVTCAIGGYTSARFARMVPQPVLRGLVIFIGFSMAAWFFWKNP
jgi:uncharacterized membrane protein YfcA